MPGLEPFWGKFGLRIAVWARKNGGNKMQVQHNSVELAMEWLINHPEEEAPAGQAAGGEGEGAGAEADIAGSFPQPAEETVASSSSGPVSSSFALFGMDLTLEYVFAQLGVPYFHQLYWKRLKCHLRETRFLGTGANHLFWK